ncbi:signal peptidase I [Qipengyuania sp.]|uniref:signal peptidase I n=1 Tax=Qipengyuania sp. TaxID=2004515 RepID=UPI0035C87060
MNANPEIASAASSTRPRAAGSRRRSFWPVFLGVLAGVVAFRSFVFTPFTIPSESMLPSLVNGDYLVAAKWPYGVSRWSLPFDAPLIEEKIGAAMPRRGDVVIFRHPVDHSEYIKRAIGLPGDTVEMRAGRLILNGEAVKRRRIDDFLLAVSPNTRCAWGASQQTDGDGRDLCRYARFSETLPFGSSYTVLDFGATPQDDYGPVTVPPGHVFMLGDNRDNSQDSRFPARAGGGVGMVPENLLVARAEMVLFSTDGSALWYKPWTWFTAARWGHMGEKL